MGLDMDLYMVKRKVKQQEVFGIKNEELIEVAYWRKFRMLQELMNTFWDKNNTGLYDEINQEDLVVTKDMLCQMFDSILKAKHDELKEYQELHEWDESVHTTLDLFDKLIGSFDFENHTLIYSCSY